MRTWAARGGRTEGGPDREGQVTERRTRTISLTMDWSIVEFRGPSVPRTRSAEFSKAGVGDGGVEVDLKVRLSDGESGTLYDCNSVEMAKGTGVAAQVCEAGGQSESDNCGVRYLARTILPWGHCAPKEACVSRPYRMTLAAASLVTRLSLAVRHWELLK